ncbi:MAG: DUF4286 family protein [Bacteroidota bacterium]|nr:DUF4286 family protein [Bacteroidota bacterium]
MLIYNITLKIEWTIQSPWLQWMQQVYITAIMDTGCFTRYQLVRLVEIEEEEGPTYALQLYAANREHYNNYIENHLLHFEAKSYEKWGGDVLLFSTVMEIVE